MAEDKIKQVLVIRRDLNMRKGKMVAQGAHAAMMFLAQFIKNQGFLTQVQKDWFDQGMTKICVGVPDLTTLNDIAMACVKRGVTCFIVMDAGHTEFHGVPTITAMAIGPDYESKIDVITKELKLL